MIRSRVPYYLNPYNVIEPLFNLESSWCFSRINDISSNGLTEILNAALTETDRSAQRALYKKAQSLIFDVEKPVNDASHTHISIWVDGIITSIHNKNLTGLDYNLITIPNFYKCYWDDTSENIILGYDFIIFIGILSLSWIYMFRRIRNLQKS